MMAEARFTQDMDGIAPFLGVSLIWNSFSASGGSGPAPREYDYTPLLSVGFNFSNDLLYGMVAMQGERDKEDHPVLYRIPFLINGFREPSDWSADALAYQTQMTAKMPVDHQESAEEVHPA